MALDPNVITQGINSALTPTIRVPVAPKFDPFQNATAVKIQKALSQVQTLYRSLISLRQNSLIKQLISCIPFSSFIVGSIIGIIGLFLQIVDFVVSLIQQLTVGLYLQLVRAIQERVQKIINFVKEKIDNIKQVVLNRVRALVAESQDQINSILDKIKKIMRTPVFCGITVGDIIGGVAVAATLPTL